MNNQSNKQNFQNQPARDKSSSQGLGQGASKTSRTDDIVDKNSSKRGSSTSSSSGASNRSEQADDEKAEW